MSKPAENKIFNYFLFAFAFVAMIGLVYADNKHIHEPLYDFENEKKSFISLDSPQINLPYNIYNYGDPNTNQGSNINLNPSNYQNNITYDPQTGTYIFNNTVGGYNYQPSTHMTLEEYTQYDMQQALQNNWQSIVSENDPNKNASVKAPPIVTAEEDIFGKSKLIDIKPSGTAELKFGINSSRTDNPQIPVKQRRITIFDFDQNMQLNVVGTIGDKLKLTTSYNTKATFDFENVMKLEYRGFEDEIIQAVEAGNVNLPLTSSLITGSQSLFGLKTQLRFGRLTVTSVFSQQKGRRTEIQVTGGAQVQNFEISADNYEANKHFFLAHYFRDNYDNACKSLPIVNSQINITRIEVWVTNINNTVDNTRNILAFADLGEAKPAQWEGTPGNPALSPLPDNNANALYTYLNSQPVIRGFNNATALLNSQIVQPGPFQQAVHYEKVQNARRLTDQEFNYNPLLGFITLNQPLNNDEVLAVAFQYTYQGQVYQVGEFAADGTTGTDALYLKLLKGTIINPNFKRWDLMMKNIYSIGAYQVSRDNFRLDVWYNNPVTSVDVNFIPKPGLDDKPLIQTLGMDRYDPNNNAFSDGVFDFMPITFAGNKATSAGTINPHNGRIYFTTVEPFGENLKQRLIEAGLDQQTIQSIVFQPLYDSTKTAAQQIPQLNRFKIKGRYQSSGGSEIPLNAMNIPQGAVTVTAGGRALVENQDYTVDYNLGRVKIINQSLLESQVPINISVESNTLFNIQTKTLLGSHFDYRVNKDINVGASILNLTERPLTQKINIGDEPISNTMIGLNGNFRKEAPWLTRLVDKIPLISTKEKSVITASAEYARIIPGTARAIQGLSYIDDFEGSQSAIDLRSFTQWHLASTPKGQNDLFPEGNLSNDLRNGMNRAKLAWYVIDPLFFNNNNLTPAHIKNSPMQSNHTMRQVFEQEVFPNRQLPTGQPTNIAVLDLAYYPTERGPYNYDCAGSTFSGGINANGRLNNPGSRWAGIMRPIQTTDFELANIEFIQIWMMDPFNDDAINDLNTTGGDLYINLGNISEDILADSRRSFENGMPTNSTQTGLLDQTVWGNVPNTQPVVNAFENTTDPNIRLLQDIGYDGLKSGDEEANYFNTYTGCITTQVTNISRRDSILADASGDDYTFYRDDRYDSQQRNILERYKRYNNPEGNSPTNEFSTSLNAEGYPTSATNIPNVEDINQDNNLNETEAYFQYKISLRPADMVIGRNFITDILVRDVQMPNGQTRQIKWYQFKIPIRNYERVVNGIQDFRSIRFMRMFLKNFDNPAVIRFARLELIRGEWRIYRENLIENGEYIQGDPANTLFSLSAVNIEENGNRQPIPYVLPPGINRQIDVSTANLRNLNEQSLSLEICGLQDGDARACYRNVNFDIRSYKRLKMFVHAETTNNFDDITKDDDVTLFLRMGTDFTDNYYEYEIPLKMTPWGATLDTDIWPNANEIDLEFQLLKDVKNRRNLKVAQGLAFFNQLYVEPDPNNPKRLMKVIGNPNLQGLKIIMVGVRNPHKNSTNPWKPDDGLPKCLEVWINELRLTDFDQQGGWAAIGRVNANLADFGNVALSGNYSTPYWGSMEKRVSERQREYIYGWDGSTALEFGKFFPEKWNLKIPVYFGYGENFIRPQFDPLNPDILLLESMQNMSPEEQKIYKQKVLDYTRRKSFNLTNVRKDRGEKAGKTHFWDIENFSATYSFSEIFHRDINTEYNVNRIYRVGLNYTFNNNPKAIEPFKKVKWMKSKWWNIIKDINFYLMPKVVSVRSDINRTYSANLIRNNFGALTFPTYTKNFTWIRAYDLKWDISKNIKFDFTATNNGVIGEPFGRVDKAYADEYQLFKDSVMASIRKWGINRQYMHTANVNITWPINKIPLLDWVTLTTRYSVSYDWQRAPFAQDTLGHTIQNSRNVSWNAQLNFNTLYNKVPFFKNLNQKIQTGAKPNPKTPAKINTSANKQNNNSSDTTKTKKPDNKSQPHYTPLENIARVIMMLKTASFTYSTTDGMMLPGFGQVNNLLGMDYQWNSPGWGFVSGRQNYDLWGNQNGWNGYDQYAYYAADQGWLVQNQYINNQYTVNHTSNLQARASIEPLTGLRVELNAEKNVSENRMSLFRYFEEIDNQPINAYLDQNVQLNGMMSMSIIAWKTVFFRDNKENVSPVFEKFRDIRTEASVLLGQTNPNSAGQNNDGYYDGYSGTQQDVLISSFIAAYTGSSVKEKHTNPFKAIPMPNWRITYDPMSKAKWVFFKKWFKSFNISHSYRSNLAIANYSTNLLGTRDNEGHLDARDQNNNFINDRLINTIALTEQTTPFSVDITWNLKNKGQTSGLITKLEIKRDRNLSLSLVNNQVTELRGKELVIGTGYKFNKLRFPFKIGGKYPENDLNCRIDLSIRDNVTITRKIVENINQPTAGQRLFSIRSSADYRLTEKLTLRFYFDRTLTKPKITTAFPTGNTSTGIAIRFTL